MIAFFLYVTAVACLTLIVTSGYNMVLGRAKILYFGQQAQILIAIYTLWVLVMQFEYSFFLALLIAAIATACASIILAWMSLKLEPDGFGVLSIALHLSVFAVVLNWQSVTRGALGIPGIPRFSFMQSAEMFTLVIVIVTALWIAFVWWLNTGAFGRQLAALSEHEWHAQGLGVNRKRVYTCVFLLSGCASLLMAIFYPSLVFLLTPSDFHFPAFIFLMTCLVAGGPGSTWGVVISTLLLVLLREGLRFVGLPPDILGPVRLMLFGLILFAAIWIRKDTLFPQQRRV